MPKGVRLRDQLSPVLGLAQEPVTSSTKVQKDHPNRRHAGSHARTLFSPWRANFPSVHLFNSAASLQPWSSKAMNEDVRWPQHLRPLLHFHGQTDLHAAEVVMMRVQSERRAAKNVIPERIHRTSPTWAASFLLGVLLHGKSKTRQQGLCA